MYDKFAVFTDADKRRAPRKYRIEKYLTPPVKSTICLNLGRLNTDGELSRIMDSTFACFPVYFGVELTGTTLSSLNSFCNVIYFCLSKE